MSRTPDALRLDRSTRFIIDDPECHERLAYGLTKPLRTGQVYNGNGVFSFITQEVETTVNDNLDLMVADYYKYYPKPDEVIPDKPRGGTDKERKVWI